MQQKQRSKAYGPLMMVGAALCFSTGGCLIRLIPWNGLAINGARNLVSVFVVGLYLLLTKHKLRFNFTVFMGALCIIAETSLFTVANKMTGAANTIILQYTEPVWLVILMFLFFGKRPQKAELITILLVLAGILCFFFDSLSAGRITGDLLAVLSGMSYAGVFLMNSFPGSDGISSVFFGQLASAVILTPLTARETDFSAPVLLAVFILGFVQVAIAYILFSESTRYTPPVTASLICAIEPILNPVLVAVFFGDLLTPLALIGAFVVIGSVVVYNIYRAKNPERAPTPVE